MRLKRFSLVVVLVFVSSIIYCQLSNDVCSDAIFLQLDQCEEFSNVGATASLNPTPGVTCDDVSPVIDTWFKAVMPAEGLLEVSTDQVSGGLTNTVIEAYSGSCNSLSYLDCDSFFGPGSHAQVVITDIPVGDTIFFRILDSGSNNFGGFQVCHSFIDRSNCFIDSIRILDQLCNPETNTFTQIIDVYYQASDSVNAIVVDVTDVNRRWFFDLTGSPRTIQLDSIFAVGVELELELSLIHI